MKGCDLMKKILKSLAYSMCANYITLFYAVGAPIVAWAAIPKVYKRNLQRVKENGTVEQICEDLIEQVKGFGT